MSRSHRRPIAWIAVALTIAAASSGCMPVQHASFDSIAEHERTVADTAADTLTLASDSAPQDSSVTSRTAPAHRHRRSKRAGSTVWGVAMLLTATGACAMIVVLLIAPFKALHDL